MWLVAGLLLAGMAAFLAFLSLSAGSAYGSNYHSLSPRQRAMGRLLLIIPVSIVLIFVLLFEAFKTVKSAALIILNADLRNLIQWYLRMVRSIEQ